MDAAFIEQNQIIERYLAGKLPVKGAQDFEQYCREHPETLTKLGMAERVNAGLRLMDVSGQPEPWAEKPVPVYSKLPFIATLGAATLALLVSSVMLQMKSSRKDKEIAALKVTVAKQPLMPATSTRAILITPSRSGPENASTTAIGGGTTEMADLKFDVSWSTYNNFKLTVDRVDQGRTAVLTNLAKDSNGHLRIALNSSALGPGDYAINIEGMDWSGKPIKQAWANLSVAH
jgi:hypothetical protein